MQISFFKCLFVIIVIVLLMNSRQHFTTFTQSFITEKNQKCGMRDHVFHTYQKCLEEMLPNKDLWKHITPVMEMKCGMKLLSRLLNVKFLRNKDEVKKFIYPVSMDEKIVSISLGIGNDNQVEKQLKEIFKNIELFGADPFEATAESFFWIGIANDGKINGTVLVDGSYKTQTIPSITFGNYLKKINRKFIDFLLIDIEGPEYFSLPQIFESEMRNEYTVCQINVELHGPLKNYGVDDKYFDKIMLASLSSSFLPLDIEMPYIHHQVFYLNWRNRDCVQKSIISLMGELGPPLDHYHWNSSLF
ncbi:unnamed protein product, partial [Mesorhabditis belari]|uniref:Methyltransferase FkbM domain-containing protein n=1 Tax=Mesorhabditis belari TaxID=2138241 RepID=A0AAF3EQD0_9BILA